MAEQARNPRAVEFVGFFREAIRAGGGDPELVEEEHFMRGVTVRYPCDRPEWGRVTLSQEDLDGVDLRHVASERATEVLALVGEGRPEQAP